MRQSAVIQRNWQSLIKPEKLEVEPGAVFEIFERIMRDAAGRTEYHYVLLDYICTVAGGALAAASDASRAVWVREDELASYRITEGTLAVVQRAFRARKNGR